MAALGTRRPLRANLLKESAAADLIMQRAQDQLRLVRQRGTMPEGGATRGQVGERSQQGGLNRGRGRRDHDGAQKKSSPDLQD